MRITPAKIVKLSALLLIVIVIFVLFVTTQTREFTSTCDMSEDFIERLYALMRETHLILDKLKLTHFLCYGSLFGQIRYSETPAWEKDGEFCLLNQELSQYDEVFLKRTFRQRDLDITYDSSEGG